MLCMGKIKYNNNKLSRYSSFPPPKRACWGYSVTLTPPWVWMWAWMGVGPDEPGTLPGWTPVDSWVWPVRFVKYIEKNPEECAPGSIFNFHEILGNRVICKTQKLKFHFILTQDVNHSDVWTRKESTDCWDRHDKRFKSFNTAATRASEHVLVRTVSRCWGQTRPYLYLRGNIRASRARDASPSLW